MANTTEAPETRTADQTGIAGTIHRIDAHAVAHDSDATEALEALWRAVATIRAYAGVDSDSDSCADTAPESLVTVRPFFDIPPLRFRGASGSRITTHLIECRLDRVVRGAAHWLECRAARVASQYWRGDRPG